MSIVTEFDIRDGAGKGWQHYIRGSNANAGAATEADLTNGGTHAALKDAGALATGTFYFALAVAGCDNLDITLRMSAHTGTVATITAYPVLPDKISVKGTPTAVTALVDATQQTTTLSSLRGANYVIVKIVVPAASSITFDQASYTAL